MFKTLTKLTLFFLAISAVVVYSNKPQKTPTKNDEASTFTKLIWSDEFDGKKLDPKKWQYETGTGVDFYPFMNGWGNDELQYYSPDNVTIEKGNLVITTKYHKKSIEGKNYTSGKIVTKDKFSFTYGRVEARVKLPYGDVGLWPAFWMVGTNIGKAPGKTEWAQCGEVDIMEMGGLYPFRMGSAMHYGAWPNNRYQADSLDYKGKGFHTYRVDRTETEIKAYMDGTLYHTFKIDNDDKKEAFLHPMYLLLNVAVGGRFYKSGNPVPENYKKGIKMYVDWVRVYQ